MGRSPRILPPRRYGCLFCGFQFRWNRDLEAHMNIHTKERPYACDECDATYLSSSMLGVHKKTVHGDFRYQCHTCRKIFSNSGNLAAHRRAMKHFSSGNPKISGVTGNVSSVRGRRSIFRRGRKTVRNSRLNTVAIKNGNPYVKVKDEPKSEENKVLQIKLERVDDSFPRTEGNLESAYPASAVSRRGRSGNSRGRGRRRLESWKRKQTEEKYSEQVQVEANNDQGFVNSSPQPFTFDHSNPLLPYFDVNVIANRVSEYHRKATQRWDSSFFLHMNRYDPKDSCFSDEFAKRAIPIAKPKATITPMKNKRIIFQNKRGRPPRLSEEEKKFVDPTSVHKGEIEIENLEGGYVKCPYCPKALFNSNLNAHLLIHTGEKPFKCSICELRFRQKSHMIKHIVRYHRYGVSYGQPGRLGPIIEESEKDPTCAFCGKTITNILFMEQHLLRSHNDKMQRVN